LNHARIFKADFLKMAENNTFNTSWRKTAATIYKKPEDSKIFGSVDLDITALAAYIKKQRALGNKITYTHFFMVATARALATEIPAFNTFVKRGNIVSHEDIIATVSVLLETGDMGSVKVPAAHKITLLNAHRILAQQISDTRNGNENKLMKMKDTLGTIPWPFRKFTYGIIKKLTIDWGLEIPFLGLKPSSFGSFVLSNIGTLGLDLGYPALLPSANIAFVMMMGKPTLKPWVHDGQVVAREVITLSAALDHRVADASHAGKLFQYYKKMIQNPELLEVG
jgi:pyruvate/2-oxoglutarate dehydrogenase complex dihydrolipoamide acyltransferase (E2) component